MSEEELQQSGETPKEHVEQAEDGLGKEAVSGPDETVATEQDVASPETGDDVEKLAERELAPHQPKNQREIDARSVFVGNVDYAALPDDLKEFFNDCGEVNRVTILFNRFTGKPKGYAYVEFEEVETVALALAKTGAELKERPVTITQKRTNFPGMGKRGKGKGRGRGGRRGGRRRKEANDTVQAAGVESEQAESVGTDEPAADDEPSDTTKLNDTGLTETATESTSTGSAETTATTTTEDNTGAKVENKGTNEETPVAAVDQPQ